MNVIPADFRPEFRAHVAQQIKYYGVKRVTDELVEHVHPSFARALVRSIMRKEGW